MNLLLSPDQELLRDTTRRFLEAEWPLAAVRALGESGEWPKQVWRRGAELGWVSLLGPEQLGGGGLAGQGLLDLAIVAEEMGRLVSPAPLVPANIGVMAMAAAGSDHVDTVERIMAGELVPAWCLAEPGDAWSGDDVSAEAVPDGSDLIVDGVKLPVEAATYADLFIVVARTGPGLTQVVVPADAPGVSVEPMRTVDLVRSFGIVRLDGVRLPRSAALGSLGGATAAVEQQLLTAVALQCAETVGAMQRVLDFTVEYAFDRVSFGRPLASYQALKHRFADLKTWLEASAAAADGAADAVQAGSADAAQVVSAAKSYIGQHATALVQDCVQLHGGIGVTWEHDIHLYLRRVTVNRALHGTPEDHRERLASLLGV